MTNHVESVSYSLAVSSFEVAFAFAFAFAVAVAVAVAVVKSSCALLVTQLVMSWVSQ